MSRLVYVVLTRNEGHDMTGYFLSAPGRYIDVAGVIVGAKLPHHSEVRTTIYWSEHWSADLETWRSRGGGRTIFCPLLT